MSDMAGGWDHDPGGVFSGRVRREVPRYKSYVQHPVQKRDDQFRTSAWGSTVGRTNV